MTTAHSSSARSGTTGDAWEWAARLGYAVSGVLHLIIGFLVAQIGLGAGAEADQTFCIVERCERAVRHFAVVGRRWCRSWPLRRGSWPTPFRGGSETSKIARSPPEGRRCISPWPSRLSIVTGSGDSSGDSQAQGIRQHVDGRTRRRIHRGAIGVGIVIGGVYHVYKGATKKFLRDLPINCQATSLRKRSRVTGTLGYVAKGVALGVSGCCSPMRR